VKEYLLVFVVAAAMTYVSTPLVRWCAIRVGAFTPVRERDVHAVPIPRLGGVAMLFGFGAALLVASRLPYLRQIFGTGEMKGVLIGATIVCLVGAIDDIRELDWLTKLAGQILAAGVMAYKGVQLLSVPFFGTSTVLPTPVLVAVTVIVVLATVNAVNFIDGLDGLAVGVVAIAAFAFFIYSYYISNSYNPPNVFSNATFISAAVLGCCLGFLPHNFHPARLFMGDSGALLLGLLLAAATISLSGSVDPGSANGGSLTAALLPIAVPLAVLSLPFLDMVLAVVRRTLAGKNPWDPDRKHLHHRMLDLGHGHRNAVLILYMWAALLALGTVSLAFVESWRAAIVIGVCLAVVVALTVWLPRWTRAKRL
jgi:UDP-GlcNAc:undecaprenyl-phosphate GlcNAc-1-phosphate transferase